jgi:hypothetical protein
MSEIAEPLARESVIDPFPDGSEQKIHRMYQRRKALFVRLAEDELRAEHRRLADKDGIPTRLLLGTNRFRAAARGKRSPSTWPRD